MPFVLGSLSGWSGEQQLTLELIEKLPMGVVLWAFRESDATFRLVGSNAAAISITGVDVDRNVDQPMRVVFPHVTAEREAQYLELARRGKPLALNEVVTTGMPGGDRTIAIRAFMLNPVLLVVVFEDRTELRLQTLERSRIALELRRNEARFRGLVEGGRDVLLILGAALNHIYVTPSIRNVLGFSPEEFVAMNGVELMVDEERASLMESHQRLLQAPGAQFESTIHARHKDGSVRTLEVHVVNRLHEPDVSGLVCLMRDVTERERSRAALSRTEEQLRQAQRVESIGLLAGGVAHDFNNLLSVVTGYVSIAIESLPADAPLAQDLWQVMRASQRAAELTSQLLAFSRHQVLAPDVVDLNRIVERMDKMLRRVIGEDILLSARVQPNLGKVLVDAGQIEQVIMNLAVNARDAMPQGGCLTIQTANVVLSACDVDEHTGLRPGSHVMLAVSDTGSGMDEATQNRIFEPFFTTKERGKGTGLGLSTVLGIVQQSGGSIRCRSRAGKGSRFEVLFPETLEEPRRSSMALSIPPGLGGEETILVVEDEDQLRALTRLILERSGYLVLDARDGKAAIELAEGAEGAIDLLLTDVVLPGMNGAQVAEHLCRRRPKLKVLYVSGYADKAIINQEGVAFLQKPITPEVLRRKVRDVLDAAHPLRAPRET